MLADAPRQILVVDDEPNLRRVLGAQLSRDGYEVHAAADGEEALRILHEQYIDAVITDLRMPGLDGLSLLKRALALEPELPVIMITAHGTVDNAVEALKSGAFDYITKPFDQNEVRNVVRKALRTRALAAQEARQERPLPAARYGIIGESRVIQELRALVERVAATPSCVVMRGEVGTGKQLVARALHETSSRRGAPFIAVNCAAISPELLASDLFGVAVPAGSAPGSKPGRCELASGGTLFLDEIDSLPLALQPALLRVAQEGECVRAGEDAVRAVDVRLIVATRADLAQKVLDGAFREDLFYRLNVVQIRLPALRERPQDIPELAAHFLQKLRPRLGSRVSGIDADAERLLARYHWPGNVRELENVIERALLLCDGPTITPADLPQAVRSEESEESEALSASADGLKEQVKAATLRLERQLIERALRETHGNVTHAARLLKISRKGLQLKMKELGLRERDERDPL